MAATDPIGDMIARIKNAAQRGRSKVVTPASTLTPGGIFTGALPMRDIW